MSISNPPLVLVVDDHIPAVSMLTRLLEREGYEVISAYDGEQAIELCNRTVPDLILLDVMMPKLNGFEVLEILRQEERTSNIPTIIITAKNTPDDIEYGLGLGADDYIAKPFNPRELIARTKSKIDAQRLKDELKSKTQDLEALLRLSEELKHHLNVTELLELVLYLVTDLLSSETAIICRLDDSGLPLSTLIGRKNGVITSDDYLTETIIDDILQDSSGVILWSEDSPLIRIDDCNYGMISRLESNGETHGLLGILNRQPYSPNQERLFQGISRQVTLAIRNAELYELKTRYAIHLEDMVEERTAELRSAQQLLVRSEKLASIGRLSAGIAHEINNPLFPLRINLEHMLEDVEQNVPIVQKDIEETLKSVERISRIVRRLLEFTGKDNSNQPDIESVVLNDVIENVISLSKKYLEYAKVNVDFTLPTLPLIYANRDQIEQVFLNIIINATAAMPDGGTLSITGTIDQDEIVLEFADTGTGIPESMIDKIFEPFVSTKEDGTGLGLFISYGIIENHQGSLDVKSVVGQGATFIVRLPVAPIERSDILS